MTPRDAAALLIAVNATVLAKDAPSILRLMGDFIWIDERVDRVGGDQQAVADMSDDLFNWIMDRSTPRSPARVNFMKFMERLIYSAVPLSSKASRLSEVIEDDGGTTFEIRFHRPHRKVAFQFTYYWENPDNIGDTYHNIFEVGEFVSPDDRTVATGDRRERVIITHKTILEVGKALAS